MLLAYLTFTLLLVLTPGSTTAVVARNALSGGRAAGLAAAAGAAVGNTSHATAAGLGLAVVFARWPAAMLALRVCGALYLAWLGACGVYRAAVHADAGLTATTRRARKGIGDGECRSGFRQGLVVNLLNPAIATFYLVVVPTFLPAAAPRWYFALLAVVHVLLALVTHVAWTMALDRARIFFAGVRVRRAMEAATGAALIALAMHVLLAGPVQP